jgi:uncharacterized LabA/DUF88 family protein
MLNQQWLTVGVSTLIAGTVASVAIPSKPIATVAASTAGAVGGFFLTNSQRSHSSKSGRSDETFVRITSGLEDLLTKNNADLKNLKEQISKVVNKPEEVMLSIEKTTDHLTRLENLLKYNNTELSELKSNFDQVMKNGDRARRTAIFYDIENLLKGYNFSQEVLANLSLKEIFSAIQETGKIGEIHELGIDPIQVFGFSREPTKNAADIQLVIDAVNLANVRSSIDVFVIVSGDGGFASLAKQLHEYGKIVIGCAYQNSTSKTFQSVCDDFVWIADPEEEERQYQTNVPASISKQPGESGSQNTRSNSPIKRAAASHQSSNKRSDGLDPRNARLINQIRRRTPSSLEDTIALTQEILKWYVSDRSCQLELSRSGLYLSVVEQAVSYVIPELQTIRLGFPKFIEYMQYVCKGSELCVVRVPPSKVMLALRNSIPKSAQILPDLDAREVHCVDTYRSILANGSPIYRLPSPGELYTMAAWIVEHPTHQADLGTIVEDVAAGLNGEISSEVVKLALFSFLSAGMFIREPEGVPTSEQRLSLREDITSLEMVVHILRSGATQKLTATLPSIDEDVLKQILPDTA